MDITKDIILHGIEDIKNNLDLEFENSSSLILFGLE